MRIIHLIFGFKTGGAETMLVDIINEQSRLGHTVILIIINDCYDESVLNKVSPTVKCFMLNRKPSSNDLIMILRMNRLIHRLKPDIIHIHNSSICKLLWLNCPIFLTVHALNVSLPKSCEKISELFAISDAVKDDVEGRYPGIYRVKTIPNGICIDDIVRKNDYQLRNGKMHIVQVANLIPELKGQDLLIDAIATLNKRGIQDICVDFIGGGNPPDKLEIHARDLGVEDRVHFLGLLDRNYIYTHLKDYDLMCHPSRHEGFGLTVVEGIAAGLPVLVPNSDGPYEIIQYGRFGYTFNKGDAESLANSLEDIYKNFEERACSVVNVAYENIREQYSVNSMVEKYLEEYKGFLL